MNKEIKKNYFEIIEKINKTNKHIYEMMGNTYFIKMFFPKTKPNYGISIQSDYSEDYINTAINKFETTFFKKDNFFILNKKQETPLGITIEFDLDPKISNLHTHYDRILQTVKHYIYQGSTFEANIQNSDLEKMINPDYFKAKINHTYMTGFYSTLLKNSQYNDLKQLIIYTESNFNNNKPQTHIFENQKRSNRP